PEDLNFAQRHLRILSGLYGILRPLDLIQPYRLEMGTKLQNSRGKNLYEFWGSQIAQALNAASAQLDSPCLVNLASNEYFKVVDRQALRLPLLNISFKERRNDRYRVIAIHAKRARGLMVDYAVRERVDTVEKLKQFDVEGYQFNSELSSAQEWVFCRGDIERDSSD
ncbi:MAG: peroxide stress protein YaaA, partial [Cyanobacteria bacterium P01_F01_bin.42]